EDPEEREERLHHGGDDPDPHPERRTEEHQEPGDDDHRTHDQVDPSPRVEVAAAEQQRVAERLLDLAARVEGPETVDGHVAAREDHHDPREDDPAGPAPSAYPCFDHDQIPPFVSGVALWGL